MITRKHRFHGYGSVNAVYRQSSSVRGPLISLRYAQRDAAKPYRVAVVVSKKVHKSAVVRNRIRRRLYEAVRLQNDTIPAGTDLVFTVFSEKVAIMESPELTKAIDDLLQKAINQAA
jgi:ribonuclease P protein component